MNADTQLQRAMPVLAVTDMARSLAFYRETLGFAAHTWGQPPTFAIAQRGTVTVALALRERVEASRGLWAAYIYVRDVDALHTELVAAGATIAEPPCDRDYNCRDFTLDDPDGHAIGIGQVLTPDVAGPGLGTDFGRDGRFEAATAAPRSVAPTDGPFFGGCQCGAVRFRVETLGRPTICHCRMCQKAHGSVGGVYVTAPTIAYTRGAPKHFRSSNKVRRGFCGDCGTVLTFEIDDGGIDVSITAFDRAREIAPVLQMDDPNRLPWFDKLHALPGRSPEEQARVAKHYEGIVNHQHPDHETADWPLRRPS